MTKVYFKDILKILDKHNITEVKIIKYSEKYLKFNTKNIINIPENAKSILCFAFPYYSKKLVENKNRNISIYAAVNDYHVVINNILGNVIKELKNKYEKYNFSFFTDNSPFNELQLGVVSGLGVLGVNKLIINEIYGSYIFIGEIITDLEIEETKKPKNQECIKCNNCINRCPTNAITNKGICEKRCLSFITQKKGELSKTEINEIKKSKIIWGCDICQMVCPLNEGVKETNLEEFKKNIITELTYDLLEKDYKSRAFSFRGKKVLKRNLDILHNKI